MILRFFKSDVCARVIKHVTRLILNPLGNIEVRITVDDVHKWRSFQKDVDFDSFIMSTE